MELRERAADIDWYHTIELVPGCVTEGTFDLRPQVDNYSLPRRLDGQRVLDVGTQNGFWAFEMERRGAREVVALDVDCEADLDWPPRRRQEMGQARRDEGLRLGEGGRGFRLAKEALGSSVNRVTRNLYDVTPEEFGTFDLIFCGSVLIHMRDQLLALERLADLCTGTLVIAEEYDRLSGFVPFHVARYFADRPKAVVFWLPSVRTWKRMLWTAGFDQVVRKGTFDMRAREGWSVRHVLFHASKGR